MTHRGSALGGGFRRLWAADALSTAGDGFTLVAAPLLMTTITTSPILVAAAAAAQQLPWLLFGLHSGAVVDCRDQRRLLIGVDAVRAVLMAALALAIVTGTASIVVIYVLLFASGTGDTLVVTAGTALVPRLVERSQLTRANSRLIATRLVGGTLVARPLGAWLFTQGHATPFGVDAVSFLAGVVLLVGLPARPTKVSASPVDGPPARRDSVRDGLVLLWRDTVLRTLALCILAMNITLSGTLAILVIYARDVLRLRPTGYGVLLATLAVGGLIGTALVTPAVRRFQVSLLLKIGLLIEASTQLVLAITSTAWVAGAALLIFGVHGSVWSVLTVSLRQHRTSDAVRGRVMAAYMVLSVGGAAVGSLLGGVLAEIGGITTPMWFGAVLVGLVFLAAGPALRPSDVRLETTQPR